MLEVRELLFTVFDDHFLFMFLFDVNGDCIVLVDRIALADAAEELSEGRFIEALSEVGVVAVLNGVVRAAFHFFCDIAPTVSV